MRAQIKAHFLLFLFVLLTAGIMGTHPLMADEISQKNDSLLEPPAQETELEEKKVNPVEQFYNDCTERPVLHVNEGTDQAFCACAAAHLQKWFDRPESIKKEDSFLGVTMIKEINKDVLLSEAYGPCLYIPLYDLSYEDCYYNSKSHLFSNDPPRRKAFCTCMAEEDSTYFRDFAKPFLELKISEKKDIVDPVEEIKKDTNYYDAKFFYERNCLAKWSKK